MASLSVSRGVIISCPNGTLEVSMANREQRSNREKKKPKASEKDKAAKSAPQPFVQPELVRKPHKGKDWT
jgi:hypothetical protein